MVNLNGAAGSDIGDKVRAMLTRCFGSIGTKKRPDGIKPYERHGIYFAVRLHGIVHTSDRIAPLLEKMVHETGAHNTDLQSPESVEHLCEKCKSYAADWQPTADEIWSHHKIRESRYENYKDWKPSQPLD